MTELRIFALWGLSALGTAVVLALASLWIVRLQYTLTHLPLLASTLGLLAGIALLLALSTKDHAILSRAGLVPWFVGAEWTALATGWLWFGLATQAFYRTQQTKKETRQWQPLQLKRE